jgi:hypothetical protein
VYTLTRIEGSNPFLSAINLNKTWNNLNNIRMVVSLGVSPVVALDFSLPPSRTVIRS